MELPPLPEPDTHCWDDDSHKDVWSHSDEQLRTYVAAAVAAAVAKEREACAAVCAGLSYGGYVPPEDGAGADYYKECATDCAATIRARTPTPQGEQG